MKVEGQEVKEEAKEEEAPKKVMSGAKKIINLSCPIPVPKQGGGEVQVSQIEIGRIKVKHLESLPKGFMSDKGSVSPTDMIKFIAALSDLPLDSIREIDINDLGVITDELSSFLEKSLSHQTGRT